MIGPEFDKSDLRDIIDFEVDYTRKSLEKEILLRDYALAEQDILMAKQNIALAEQDILVAKQNIDLAEKYVALAKRAEKITDLEEKLAMYSIE